MMTGIILGFIYSFEITLIALVSVPLMFLSNSLNAKFNDKLSKIDEEAFKDANLLAGDCIINNKTIASFGYDKFIIEKYDRHVAATIRLSLKRAQCAGFWFGFS
jgi:ATP-binding cassette subfamily B (MDR/TAP) protein 1